MHNFEFQCSTNIYLKYAFIDKNDQFYEYFGGQSQCGVDHKASLLSISTFHRVTKIVYMMWVPNASISIITQYVAEVQNGQNRFLLDFLYRC